MYSAGWWQTGGRANSFVMKTTTRLLLGVIITLLLTAGLARAAEHFDPVSHDVGFTSGLTSDGTAPSCSMPCMSCDDGGDSPD